MSEAERERDFLREHPSGKLTQAEAEAMTERLRLWMIANTVDTALDLLQARIEGRRRARESRAAPRAVHLDP